MIQTTHNTHTDLQDCVKVLRPRCIIPTVNAPDAAAARAIVDRFACFMDLTRDRRRLDAYFPRLGQTQQGQQAEQGEGEQQQQQMQAGGREGDGVQLGGGGKEESGSASTGLPPPSSKSPDPASARPNPDAAACVLDAVDAEQQRRMLAEFERQQRLRRSVEAAKVAKRQRRASGSRL